MIEGEFSSPEYHCTHSSERRDIHPAKWGFEGHSFPVSIHEVLVDGPQGKTVIPLVEYRSWDSTPAPTNNFEISTPPIPEDAINIMYMGGGASSSIDNIPVLLNMLPALVGKNVCIVFVPQTQGAAREQKIINPETSAQIIHVALKSAKLDEEVDIFIGHSAAGTYGTSLSNKLKPKVAAFIDPTGFWKNESLAKDFARIPEELLQYPPMDQAPLLDRFRHALNVTRDTFLVPNGRARYRDLIYAYTIGLVRPPKEQRMQASRYDFTSQPITLDVKRLMSAKRGSLRRLQCETLVVVTNGYSRVVNPLKNHDTANLPTEEDVEPMLNEIVNGPGSKKSVIYPGHHNSHITDPDYWTKIAPAIFNAYEN